MPDVPAVSPGAKTSEFSLRQLLMYVLMAVTALGTILTTLSQFGIGDKWVGPALILIGVVTKLLNAQGYQSSREALKTAAINAAVLTPGADELAHLLPAEADAIIDQVLASAKEKTK